MRLMAHRVARWLAALACLAFLSAGAPAEAAKHKKGWPSKKAGKAHKKSPSSPASGKSAAPADDDADEEEAPAAAQAQPRKESNDDDADAPPFKPKKVAKAKDEDEDEDGDSSSSGGGDDDSGEGTVVRKKARKTASAQGEEGAPVALQLAAGPRAVHRTFDFNDPLSDFQPGVAAPAAYNLPAGPTPFLDAEIYPAAFAGGGVAANIGVGGRYERLIGTTSVANKGTPMEKATTTASQQFEVGLRGRIPFGANEVGLTGTYGQHMFHLQTKDLGPNMGSVLPNVDYTFAGIGADTRIRAGAVTVGAHVGTRLMLNTGALQKYWVRQVTTKAVEAGLSVGYHLTPIFEVVGGADLLRYAFDFNQPKAGDPIIAGGAVDQYISGYLALRVSITGG